MSFHLFRKPDIDWDAAYSAGNYDGHQDDFQWGRYALIGNLIGSFLSPQRSRCWLWIRHAARLYSRNLCLYRS